MGTMIWPLAVYSAAVIGLAALVLGVSYILGERHRSRTTGEAYESGISVTESARLRIDVKFYLVAMMFVLFDVESVFIFVWAVSCREVGWAGYISILVFIAVLGAALVYLCRGGALDWKNNLKIKNEK